MVTIDGYVIDCAVTEEHSDENEITQHPVETGADIVDHIRRKPSTVSIQGIVSDTPLPAIEALRSETTLPSQEAIEKLTALNLARETFNVTTSLRSYDNMALVSLSIPRDVKTGDALTFNARFQEVILVTNNRVTVTVSSARGKKKVNRGNKPTKAAAPVTVDRDPLKAMLGGVGFDTGAFADAD